MKNNRTFLEKLLDGAEVQYEKLSDVLPIKRGKRVVRNELDENGIYPVYQNSLQPLGYFNNKNCEAYTTFVIAAGAAGEIGFSEVEFWAADDCYYFECPKEVLNNKFLYYVLMSQKHNLLKKVRKASIPRLGKDTIEKLSIPIPPLYVQTEIVKILDALTALTSKLTSELTLRQKQYEYYREKLLSEEELEKVGFEWKTLDQISENLDSKRKPITSGLRTSGKIPYYGASGIVDYVEDYIFDGDFLLISEDGANLLARNTPIAFSATGKIWVNNHAHILKFNSYEERRFIEFYLNKIDLTPYISGAAQPKLNKKNLNSIKIPIPSIPKQQRIVSILDKFETLTNSITEGLPLAIEQSQKRYEYYRELLLNFS